MAITPFQSKISCILKRIRIFPVPQIFGIDSSKDRETSTENSAADLESVDWSKNVTEEGEPPAEARISYPFNTGECGKLGRRSAVLQVRT